MPDSNFSSVSDSPLSLLEQNPHLSALLVERNLDPDQVTTLIKPVLQAKKRCRTSFYIQAVTTSRVSFLATNLTGVREMQVTEAASQWLIGRSTACAIVVANPQLSRRHAVVGYSTEGFYIADIGSSNGTWVNGHRLVSIERQPLQDGDVIRLGNTRIEFFALNCDRDGCAIADITCF